MNGIYLTAEEAARVRYNEPGKSGLDPIPRTDGTYFLGLECLNDPVHGAFLKTCATGDVPRETIKWVAAEETVSPNLIQSESLKEETLKSR